MSDLTITFINHHGLRMEGYEFPNDHAAAVFLGLRTDDDASSAVTLYEPLQPTDVGVVSDANLDMNNAARKSRRKSRRSLRIAMKNARRSSRLAENNNRK